MTDRRNRRIYAELGRDRNTYCRERPGSGQETTDVVADIVDTDLSQARFRSRRHFY
jgi:hypothetical protein